ncbi:MAG: hypothetical protein EZS28_034395 [Streblomastix strix]|uniref:ELMO domain-containing protein n=1 Tax=Streblomastix strix TaxID=222440 RepID=A0A5J4UHQ4_9EUKA|nr:MAG: hypothetical protein EZS28_034395 [Streblomastix strix]
MAATGEEVVDSAAEEESPEDEWKNIPVIKFTFNDTKDEQKQTQNSGDSNEFQSLDQLGIKIASVDKPKYTYEHALNELRERNFTNEKKEINYQPPKSFFCCGPQLLSEGLVDDIETFLSLSKVKVDNVQEFRDMLSSLYEKLIGKKPASSIGSHWEALGFQGNDPRSDFRSGGILSLLQMLFISYEYPTLSKYILNLSQNEATMFPFAVIGINLTSYCVEAAYGRKTVSEIKKTRNVFFTLNRLQAASYLHLYRIWKQGKKTIHDTAQVLQDVKSATINNPNQLLKDFDSASQINFSEDLFGIN